jgi:hypothetical protein
MKNIEELFKSALKDQELPYDEGAWNSMSKKLDSRNGGISGNLKWIIGAVGISVVTIVSVYYLSNSDSKSTIAKEKNKYSELTSKDEVKNEKTTSIEGKEAVISTETVQDSKVVISTHSSKSVKSSETVETSNSQEDSNISDPIGNSEQITELIDPVFREVQTTEETITETPETVRFNMVKDYCLNDLFSYKNSNNQSIWMKTPQGNYIEFSPSKEHKSTLNENGMYEIGVFSLNEQFESRISFQVREPQSNQLIMEDFLNYENGLPQLNARAYNDADYTWYLNNKRISENTSKATFNLFKKGTYQIKLSSKDNTGCEANSSSDFTVDKDYNLLAVNAFTPSSWDSRNTHFIPFALTQRNTPFKMIVIDPADGGIVFETSSADLPWDGIDRNSGKMVEPNKSYLWKVILDQPEPNEKPEYIGTVVRL